MEHLLDKIEKLKKSKIKEIVDARIKEFEKIGKNEKDIFKELGFCILTANFTAERSIKIQAEFGDEFCLLAEKELAEKLKKAGHRFPNKRAEFIVCAQDYNGKLKEIISKYDSEIKLREFFSKNIKGLGLKEASHFLRNIGFKNLAIVDFHIVDLLVKEGLIEKPKNLNEKRYIEIENVLLEIARKAKLSLAELDLYLWYIETGKVLK